MFAQTCQVVKLTPDFALIKVPDTGKLVFADKANFVELYVDADDLTLQLSIGQRVTLRSISEVQRPVQGCKLIADEWGLALDTVDLERELEESSEYWNSPSSENCDNYSQSVGFVVNVESTRAFIYALRYGFVSCPRRSFEREYQLNAEVWNSVCLGSWFSLQLDKVHFEDNQGSLKALGVQALRQPPPMELSLNQK